MLMYAILAKKSQLRCTNCLLIAQRDDHCIGIGVSILIIYRPYLREIYCSNVRINCALKRALVLSQSPRFRDLQVATCLAKRSHGLKISRALIATRCQGLTLPTLLRQAKAM